MHLFPNSRYTLQASHDFHTLREHDGAHDLSGPMPVGALSAESCMVFAVTPPESQSRRTARWSHSHNRCAHRHKALGAHTPWLTRLPRPEIARWSTRSNCSDTYWFQIVAAAYGVSGEASV